MKTTDQDAKILSKILPDWTQPMQIYYHDRMEIVLETRAGLTFLK